MRSSVEVYDLDQRVSHVVLDSAQHLEAPNWTRDDALIVNGGGRLYRLSLDGGALDAMDTGDCAALNNDHGLSPDGGDIAFSDKTETGKSCIYIMPAGGGDPRRITAKVPSWWHGWTAQGELLYTAVRDGQFGIWACPASGGNERCILTSDHHYDGPDATPDGEWIWFNSERGGPSSQLWRVRSDGSDPQQMTSGARVDWFPHPSPDGRHVLYLSYPPGTLGHPFGRWVELRLLPAGGGTPEVLLEIFGGQGSLNVPSWSPDGRRFAFVRYFEV